MKFQAIKKSGKLDINWDQVNTYASRWKDGTGFDVEIKRHEAKKSDPMRKMYYGHVLPKFMEHLGYDKDEGVLFHNQLKVAYFKSDPAYNIYQDERGIWRNIPAVFGDDSKMEISIKQQFLEWVLRKAAQYGVYIETDRR